MIVSVANLMQERKKELEEQAWNLTTLPPYPSFSFQLAI